MSKNVSKTADINISRSIFNLNHSVKGSARHGELTPFDIIPVLPGDTMEVKLNMFCRLATPIAPIMDNIRENVDVFFIPYRITWDKYREFWGENDESAGMKPLNKTIPCTLKYPARGSQGTHDTVGTLGDCLGIVSDSDTTERSTPVSVLYARGYCLTWNRFYRPSNIVDPLIVYKDDTEKIATKDGQEYGYNSKLLKVFKQYDRFTACTISPQAGDPVTLPLGLFAPVINGDNQTEPYQYQLVPYQYDPNTGSGTSTKILAGLKEPGNNFIRFTRTIENTENNSTNSITTAYTEHQLQVDLSQATAAKWNDLRISAAYQRFKEKAEVGGNRFWEFLNTHFGVKASDASLQDPELIGSTWMDLNINPIYQTTGQSNDSNSTLGLPGATSATVQYNKPINTRSFTEPGFLLFLVNFKHERTYGQGLHPEYFKKKPLDFYLPEFANVGPQKVRKGELRNGYDEDNQKPFGFLYAYEEYKHERNKVFGVLNPANKGALDFWTLGEKFGGTQTLSEEFLEEDADELERCLTTGGLGPHYMLDFYVKIKASRPMPVTSIPGFTGWY